MIFNKIFNKKKKEEKPKENKKEVSQLEKSIRDFGEGLVSVQDIIAPSAIEVDFDWIRINNHYYRTLFVVNYPRFVSANWLSSLINFDHSLDVSMNVYPTEGKEILSNLRRKIAEMEAEISSDVQRGKVVDPSTKAKLEDALSLQEELVKGVEKFFQFGLYITIGAESVKQLNQITKELESNLGSLLIIPKHATLQMEHGFTTTLPLAEDRLNVTRNMDTTSLATTFPFVSSDLSDDKGVMYGLNQHNGSLVVFDRFSMENANSVLFAKSGAGKSYLVKLEALRSLMFGTEVMVLDPENEYKALTEAVGGQFITFSFESGSKINPFDLEITPDEEVKNQLGRKIMALHSLFKLVMGEMDAKEEALLDRALVQTYKMRGITPTKPPKPDTEMPLVEDLYKVLLGMEEEQAASLAARLEKFIKGSFAGLFNSQTNVELDNEFIVFGIRDLEEELRPIAMQIVLDFIWNKIRKELKKRILIVDEGWYLMQYADTAQYLFSLAKRARKYYLGLTTITQDVQDFLGSDYGKAIVTNSSIQVLLKQHPAAIDQVAEVFYLSEGEKQLLLGADIGEGIFFAGQNHVAIRVIASPDEHKLITSSPEDIIAMKKGEELKAKPSEATEEK
jgi:conjugal transfer ATP-binding protein TraC